MIFICSPFLGMTASKIISKVTIPSVGLFDSVGLPFMSNVSSTGIRFTDKCGSPYIYFFSMSSTEQSANSVTVSFKVCAKIIFRDSTLFAKLSYAALVSSKYFPPPFKFHLSSKIIRQFFQIFYFRPESIRFFFSHFLSPNATIPQLFLSCSKARNFEKSADFAKIYFVENLIRTEDIFNQINFEQEEIRYLQSG